MYYISIPLGISMFITQVFYRALARAFCTKYLHTQLAWPGKYANF